MPLVVYKLGGSLLELPGLPGAVRMVLDRRKGCGALIVVGGGEAADLVRRWDQVHQLGQEPSHWLALEAMRLNEALLRRLVPGTRFVRNAKQASAVVGQGDIGLLCTDCFVRWGESLGHTHLPRSWDVTSDSIAAWAAGILEADELVLLKSTTLPQASTCEEAAQAGLVDREFAEFAQAVPRLSWVNLRRDPIVIEEWRQGLEASSRHIGKPAPRHDPTSP